MTAKHYFFNTMVPAVFYGTVTGIVVGAVIWGYSFLAEEILSVSQNMYDFMRNNLVFLPLLIAVLLIAATISFFNTKFVPEAKGGGVPYIEGAARGILPLKWYKVAPAAILGSFLSFLCGLPLGSEGPSVLIGGALGSGVNSIGGKYDKKKRAWARLAITGGASAGFATALNAPLAGILFALEECHKKFSPVVLLTSAVSVLFAVITSGLLRFWTGMGEHALFAFEIAALGVTSLYLPLIAGIVAGLAAVGFSFLLLKGGNVIGKIKLPRLAKVMLAFLLSGAACLFFADLIGGGAGIIRKVGNMGLEWQIILVLLIIKVFLLVFCSSAQVSGGMFIPFLCLGALVGGLLAKLLVVCGMSETYYSTIVVISMCAFLGSILKAPITAVVLIVELAGGVSSLLVSLIAIVAAYLITELFHTKPIYDEMLENILKNRQGGKVEVKTVKIEMKVMDDSYAIGKALRDILLPSGVISVQHKNESEDLTSTEQYRRGDRRIRSGDHIIIDARTSDVDELKSQLADLFGSENNHI
ncbi:MAG: chloride channel protein [Clostridiales bacterium]|nr:chloride channel protein [Clostridiales bacterium]